MPYGHRWLLCLGLSLAAPAIALGQGAPPAAAGPDYSAVQEKATDLGHGLYWIEGAGGNTTVAVGKAGIIVVDSQFAPVYPKLKASIAALSSRPVKYVVNTHYHGDHTGGNASFAKDGATIVAQENARTRITAATAGAPAAGATDAGVPTQTYKDRLTLDVGGQGAELSHPIGAHTDGDTIVYFRGANVLATGDIVGFAAYPNIDVDVGGGIDGMILAVDGILSKVDAKTRIVPGHGAVTDRAGLLEYRAMLVTARERVARAILAGQSEDELFASKPLADLDKRWLLAGNRFAEMFPRLVYRSLKKQGLAPASGNAATDVETRRVADGVYAFRYGGYQSVFVVGKDGVIVTDPSARNKPGAMPALLAEIRKVTPLPVRFVIYTHSGYDHIAGGKPLKDRGATFIAHQRTLEHLKRMNNAPDVVLPDRTVKDGVTSLTLAGVPVHLVYPGPTRSDNMISVFLPRQKVLYAADWIGVGSAPCMNTSCSPATWNYDHAVQSVMALDWDLFVPGHSGPGGRFGGKPDLQRIRDYLSDLNAYTSRLAGDNRCNAEGWKSSVVPEQYRDFVQPQVYQDQVERYCLAWNQGG